MSSCLQRNSYCDWKFNKHNKQWKEKKVMAMAQRANKNAKPLISTAQVKKKYTWINAL